MSFCENDILIRFDSPIVYALNEYEKRPCWGMTDAIPGFSHLRKAHSMFGWDWGPRLPDMGIFRLSVSVRSHRRLRWESESESI